MSRPLPLTADASQQQDTLTLLSPQAASSLENLKMSDSPVKKINFGVVGKENTPSSTTLADAPAEKIAEKPTEASKVAQSIKELEANEPLLQENPHRFVLFPIKYHEVSVTSTTRHA